MKIFPIFQVNSKKIMDAAKHCLFLACLFLLASASACSTIKGGVAYLTDETEEFTSPRHGRMDFDFADGMRIYKDANIYLGEMVTRVHPNKNLDAKPTALFVPLGLVQASRDHEAVSQGVSRIVYECFLAEATFSALEFARIPVPYQTEAMLPYACEKGADYLVGGIINQYYDGGAAGDSRFAMELYVYQVSTGNLMWSVHHSGVLPYKPDGDFAFYTVKTRMPVNPMSTLISAIGKELALLLHYWTDPVAMQKYDFQKEGSVFDPRAF